MATREARRRYDEARRRYSRAAAAIHEFHTTYLRSAEASGELSPNAFDVAHRLLAELDAAKEACRSAFANLAPGRCAGHSEAEVP